MRGAHAARALLLICSSAFCGFAAAGQFVQRAEHHVNPRHVALDEYESVKMPSGYAALCARDPGFCRLSRTLPRDVLLSPERWELLSRINLEINQRIVSETDEKLYGKAEFWTIPTTAGDCEDYVLLKRQLLQHLGFPDSSLLITVVHDENGDGHAVLTIPTTAGDLVLDNRRDDILPWWETGYAFIKRQSAADPEHWVALGRDDLQTMVMASGSDLP